MCHHSIYSGSVQSWNKLQDKENLRSWLLTSQMVYRKPLSSVFLSPYEIALEKDAFLRDYCHKGIWMLNLDRNSLGDRVCCHSSLKSILTNMLQGTHDKDVSEWRWTINGQFSVRSTYITIIDGGQVLQIAT